MQNWLIIWIKKHSVELQKDSKEYSTNEVLLNVAYLKKNIFECSVLYSNEKITLSLFKQYMTVLDLWVSCQMMFCGFCGSNTH